ncbi:MAG: KpsF/GutQ family sugar-phosphate isomerase [Rhabdochlamydiaceae bacterium]|jgi:arabinose-5-phosphate isomerase
MLRELFTQQQQSIQHFFSAIDIAQVEKVVESCLQTKGFLVLTGIGKSGMIAEKIAMTLISTGTKALYLPSVNFLHGDIGILSQDDTVLLFSKSGETEELIALIPFIRKKAAKIIAIVSNLQSRLSQQADLALCLPVDRELCPFDLAPTTSTEVQLLFGDVLSVALMKARNFTLSDYGDNHPSGSIGKKILLKVEDLMMKGSHVPFCKPEDKVADVLTELTNKKCGCLVVTGEKDSFLGIFTDGDLRRSLQRLGSDILEKTVAELMTRTAIVVQSNDLAWDALKVMQKDPKKWIMVTPVLDNNKVVGLLRMHDIIHAGLS